MLIILFNKPEVVGTIMTTLNCRVRVPTKKYYFSRSCSISSPAEDGALASSDVPGKR